jgi:hypothetical protein
VQAAKNFLMPSREDRPEELTYLNTQYVIINYIYFFILRNFKFCAVNTIHKRERNGKELQSIYDKHEADG